MAANPNGWRSADCVIKSLYHEYMNKYMWEGKFSRNIEAEGLTESEHARGEARKIEKTKFF